jgi:hypothetical protein
MAIDIGPGATNRASNFGFSYTVIALGNPANEAGTVTDVEIWANANMSGCKVGIFYLVSGTTYKCRSAASIGNVTAGSKQTFSGLSLAVQVGDYIGLYWSGGYVERDTDGQDGHLYVSGDKCVVDNQSSYTAQAGDAISVYGYSAGITAPTITVAAASNITAIAARINGNVTDTGGENPTVTVYYGKTDGGTTPGSWDSSSAPTLPSQPQGVAAFYLDFSGLDSDTTYYFSARAVNSGGTDWPVASGSFSTSEAQPTVTTGAATAITATTATLNGTLDSLGDSPPVDVSFEWGETDGYGSETTPVEYGVTGSPSADITGLTEGTTYHFRIKAVDADSNIVYGADAEFSTYSYVTVSFEAGLTSACSDWAGGSQSVIHGESFDAIIDLAAIGASAGNTIYFRAKAYNGVVTAYGEVLSFTLAGYPTVTTTRVSGLTHRWQPGRYVLEVDLGGLSSGRGVPVPSGKYDKAIPPPSGTVQQPLQITRDMYESWLRNTDFNVILQSFGHFPTFEEWVTWYVVTAASWGY